MRKLLWIYRIGVGMALLAGLCKLIWEIIFFLLKQITLLYLPYSAWLVGAVFLGLGVWAMVSEIRQNKQAKQEAAARMAEQASQPDWDDAADLALLQTILDRYPQAERHGGECVAIPFKNPEHGVYCQAGDCLTLGLCDSPHHDHYDWGVQTEQHQGLLSDLEEILQEKQVQAIFYDKNGKEWFNDLYEQAELERRIQEQFHPFKTTKTLWGKALQILFLWIPPIEPAMVRVEVFSAWGTYDQTLDARRKE